jgi:cysteine-rich repeat protein
VAARAACLLSLIALLHGMFSPGSAPGLAAPVGVCTGDCNLDGVVTIDDLILMTALALTDAPSVECAGGDVSMDGRIQVDEIIVAVDAALDGCTETPPPTGTPIERTLAPTPSPTPSPTAVSLCGNGLWRNEGEQCDDGNTHSGDGCDANCRQEYGFICSGEPSECIYSPGCPGTFSCSGTPNPTPTPTPPPQRAKRPPVR